MKLSKKQIAVLVAAGVGVISVMLPWMSAFGLVSFSGFSDWAGVLSFLLFLAAAGLCLFSDKIPNLTEKNAKLATVGAGGLAALFTFIFMARASFNFLSFGVWLCLLAGVAVAVLTWFGDQWLGDK